MVPGIGIGGDVCGRDIIANGVAIRVIGGGGRRGVAGGLND